MKEQNVETYADGAYGHMMAASETKAGKTCYLAAGSLGILPWQKATGGIVDRPENLHVVTFDKNAAGGLKRFFLETCLAPAESLKMRIYNMSDDLEKMQANPADWNFDLFNGVMDVLQTVAERASKGGTHVVLISSLTGMASALHRALAGAPGAKKGAGMDMAKWDAFAAHLREIRGYAQAGRWHCFWEAHVYKPQQNTQDKDAAPPRESIQIPGKSAYEFTVNVPYIVRIRRQVGDRYENTACEKTYLDTRAQLDFLSGGRNFTEALEAKEYNPTLAFQKLGLQVGGWGAKTAAVKAVANTK